MQCEVKNTPEEGEERRSADNLPSNLPPRGFVQQVCQEWVVHEDSAFAHRLQKQEIDTHYGQNRNVRRVVRDDIQQARIVQQEEEVEALNLQMKYERLLLQQEEADEKIARELQENEVSALDILQHTRDADEAYARHVQEKEKEKFDRKKREKGQMKEIRQVQKLRIQHTSDQVLETEAYQRTDHDLEPKDTSENLHDLSEFCLQPTPDMNEPAARRLQEEQDAELARLMQEQETKRSGYFEKDNVIAAEAQDRELAAMLQEQERTRARRLKEKAKRKALLKQQSDQLLHEEIEPYACSTILDPRRTSTEELVSLSSSLRSTATRSHELNSLAPDSQNSFERHRNNTSQRWSEIQSSGSSKDMGETLLESPANGHRNVAMVIDPTYLRKQSGKPLNDVEDVEENVSGGSTPVLPSPVSLRTGAYQGREDEYYDSDENPAPPYMPIQGQKRNSLEKKKKVKSGKDSCKQQ